MKEINPKLSSILDGLSKGLSALQIAKTAHCALTTVYEVAEQFPLFHPMPFKKKGRPKNED